MMGLWLLTLALHLTSSAATRCEDLANAYTSNHPHEPAVIDQPFAFDSNTSSSKQPPLVFFLHVPRTAGRSFTSCFLKAALPTSKK
jgi:hypothetical protein